MAHALNPSATPAMQAAGVAILEARLSKVRGGMTPSSSSFESPQPSSSAAASATPELAAEVAELKAALLQKDAEIARMHGEVHTARQERDAAVSEKAAAVSAKESTARELAVEVGRRDAAELMVSKLMAMVSDMTKK